MTRSGVSAPVSIHAPVWGRQSIPPDPDRCIPGFDPRPRVGATATLQSQFFPRTWFRSTPPCGGDDPAANSCRSPPAFRSTPPCGGDSLSRKVWRGRQWFRSTPPCGGDAGATAPAFDRAGFDPRPRVGATRPRCPSRSRQACFDPRPRVGATLEDLAGRGIEQVSIHAPVWGRRCALPKPSATWLFRSTPPCGGDVADIDAEIAREKFRSTPPCGGDKRFGMGNAAVDRFDPRPRVGATIARSTRSPFAR